MSTRDSFLDLHEQGFSFYVGTDEPDPFGIAHLREAEQAKVKAFYEAKVLEAVENNNFSPLTEGFAERMIAELNRRISAQAGDS